MSTTLQEFRYLVAVDEYRHFGRAAEACFVTQPTLSAGLRSLEDKLGRPLCERGPRGVIMARDADRLVEQARRVLAAARGFEEMAATGDAPLAGTFCLGAIPTVGPYLLPHVVGGIRERWPDLRLHLVEAQTADLLASLRRGDLDAALMSPPVADDGLRALGLYREEFVLALPSGHALAGHDTVALGDLVAEPLLLLEEGHCLRDQVVEFCRAGDAAARELLRSGSLETLRNMVAAGVGATLLPRLATASDPGEAVVLRELAAPAPSRTVSLYWRGGSDETAVQHLAETLQDLLPPAVTPS